MAVYNKSSQIQKSLDTLQSPRKDRTLLQDMALALENLVFPEPLKKFMKERDYLSLETKELPIYKKFKEAKLLDTDFNKNLT